MVEKYMQMKMFFEFKLPFIVLGIIAAIYVIAMIVARIIDAYEKRQKKNIDKYFSEEEGGTDG